MEKLKLDRQSLKQFGLGMGVVFLLITGFIFLKQAHNLWPAFIISASFFILAWLAPGALKPIYIFWMKLAFSISWITTRAILLIIFYFVFSSLGLAMRLLGRDLLDRKIEKSKESYWKRKEKNELGLLGYKKQF